jgi:protein O-mannosyl-transferase
VLEIKPNDVAAHGSLGSALYLHGQSSEAIDQWREVIRLQPENTPALNQLAWTLATSPTASIRNGAAAVELAQRAADLTGGRDLDILDTLAAACAEAGRFSDAVRIAEQVLAAASRQNSTALAGRVQARLRLYRAGSPYRDTLQPVTAHSVQP